MDIALQNQDHNIAIYTDSLSALLSLNTNKINIKTSHLILEIKTKIASFETNIRNKTISFFWIPAHENIPGNEEPDKLAKGATTSQHFDIHQIPYTDFYAQIKASAKLETVRLLREQSVQTGTLYFKYFYTDLQIPWFAHKNLPRKLIVTVNRIRSNHYNLASSLARVKIINSAECNCGSENEDINHVLWQCPLYENHRKRLLIKLRKLDQYLPLNIESIVAKPNINICKCILEFLEDCELSI